MLTCLEMPTKAFFNYLVSPLFLPKQAFWSSGHEAEKELVAIAYMKCQLVRGIKLIQFFQLTAFLDVPGEAESEFV